MLEVCHWEFRFLISGVQQPVRCSVPARELSTVRNKVTTPGVIVGSVVRRQASSWLEHPVPVCDFHQFHGDPGDWGKSLIRALEIH